MSKQSLTTYYAVTNVNGPISVSIEAATVAAAVEAFGEMDQRELIDDAVTDAEDELDLGDCSDMSESDFDAALEAAGCSVECELDDAARNRHVGGWWLWSAPVDDDEDTAHGYTFEGWLSAAGRRDSASEYDLRAAWRAGTGVRCEPLDRAAARRVTHFPRLPRGSGICEAPRCRWPSDRRLVARVRPAPSRLRRSRLGRLPGPPRVCRRRVMIRPAIAVESYSEGDSWVCAEHMRGPAHPTRTPRQDWPCDRCVSEHHAATDYSDWAATAAQIAAAGLTYG